MTKNALKFVGICSGVVMATALALLWGKSRDGLDLVDSQPLLWAFAVSGSIWALVVLLHQRKG